MQPDVQMLFQKISNGLGLMRRDAGPPLHQRSRCRWTGGGVVSWWLGLLRGWPNRVGAANGWSDGTASPGSSQRTSEITEDWRIS